MEGVQEGRLSEETEKKIHRLQASSGHAEGTPEWAWTQCAWMRTLWTEKKLRDDMFESIVNKLQERRVYDLIPEDKPFGTLDALLREFIGTDLHGARIQLAERYEKAEKPRDGQATKEARAEGGKKGGRGNLRSASTKVSPKRDADYWLGRIKKAAEEQKPEAVAVVEAIKRGDYDAAGVAKAARDAGVKPPPDPQRAMTNAIKKALPDKPQLSRTLRDVLAPVVASLKALAGKDRKTLAYELIRIAEEALRE